MFNKLFKNKKKFFNSEQVLFTSITETTETKKPENNLKYKIYYNKSINTLVITYCDVNSNELPLSDRTFNNVLEANKFLYNLNLSSLDPILKEVIENYNLSSKIEWENILDKI